MSKGNSEPWPDILKEFTDGRTDKISAESIMQYFKPLHVWLKKQDLEIADWNCDNYIEENHHVKAYGYENSGGLKFRGNLRNLFCAFCFIINFKYFFSLL